MKFRTPDCRALAIALAFGVATALAGCGSKQEPAATTTAPPAATPDAAPAAPAAVPTPVSATDVASATWTAEALEELLAPIALTHGLHAPAIWMGYSPQHMYSPGSGRGTITVRSTTLLNLLYDVGRSLIHHGFNRIIFVNGHGSNVKVVDPVLRKLRYETGALISFVKPYMENYVGILKGLMENPPEETPGWHSSELETSQDLAWDERYALLTVLIASFGRGTTRLSSPRSTWP